MGSTLEVDSQGRPHGRLERRSLRAVRFAMPSIRIDPSVIPARHPASPSMAQRFALAARSFLALLLAGALACSTSGAAEFIPDPKFVPKPDTYICPDATGGAVECYLQAVSHLYTMCRHVKSIEIIEFGYEKSTEGTNGAKSEYCVDKHKLSMVRPYQAALKEATPSADAVNQLRELQALWIKSLVELNWKPGETDEQYKARVAEPYEAFKERANAVRVAMAASKDKPAATADKGKKGKPATPPPKTKSAS
jgi:hypothetical protein